MKLKVQARRMLTWPTEVHVCNDVDVSNQAERVLDEEYNVLRYRRYGNRLVRNFAKMMDRRDPRVLLSTRNRDYTSFDRRSVTPNTLENRIREFHYTYGWTDEELDRLPVMKNHRDVLINPDDPPVPGGKVFVTVVQCVSCNKNVLLKNHNHIRCQMLYSLPMDRVKNYKPM